MELWKRNLWILCVAQFFVMAAMSLIVPFLPLYLKQDMGIVDENALHLLTGVIFGANFLSAFLFSPFWGKMADGFLDGSRCAGYFCYRHVYCSLTQFGLNFTS